MFEFGSFLKEKIIKPIVDDWNKGEELTPEPKTKEYTAARKSISNGKRVEFNRDKALRVYNINQIMRNKDIARGKI